MTSKWSPESAVDFKGGLTGYFHNTFLQLANINFHLGVNSLRTRSGIFKDWFIRSWRNVDKTGDVLVMRTVHLTCKIGRRVLGCAPTDSTSDCQRQVPRPPLPQTATSGYSWIRDIWEGFVHFPDKSRCKKEMRHRGGWHALAALNKSTQVRHIATVSYDPSSKYWLGCESSTAQTRPSSPKQTI